MINIFKKYYDNNITSLNDIRTEPLTMQELNKEGLSRRDIDDYLILVKEFYCESMLFNCRPRVVRTTRHYPNSLKDKYVKLLEFCLIKNLIDRETFEVFRGNDKIAPMGDFILDAWRFPEYKSAIVVDSPEDFRLKIESSLALRHGSWFLELKYNLHEACEESEECVFIYRYDEKQQQLQKLNYWELLTSKERIVADIELIDSKIDALKCETPKEEDLDSYFEKQESWFKKRIVLEKERNLLEECLELITEAMAQLHEYSKQHLKQNEDDTEVCEEDAIEISTETNNETNVSTISEIRLGMLSGRTKKYDFRFRIETAPGIIATLIGAECQSGYKKESVCTNFKASANPVSGDLELRLHFNGIVKIYELIKLELHFKTNTDKYIIATYENFNSTPKLEYVDQNEEPKKWTDDDILYIHKNHIKCQRDNHHIVSATAILTGLNHREISLNVNYCKKCKMFFMNYTTYEMYREKYGVLLGHLRMDSYSESMHDGQILADESPLKLCGYSVNQKDGYTNSTREYIISQIIDKVIMTKSEVVRYLEYFIGMNGKKRGNELALEKWKADLKFTLNYHSDVQTRHRIKEIQKYSHRY